MAPPKDTTPPTPKAPGPGVVEALQHPVAAELTSIGVAEAHDALREKLTADGRSLTITEELKLRMVANLGKQVVTAVTVPSATGGAQ
jgi:hypothetical protein